MNSSTDVTFITAQSFTDYLERIREDILYNIDATIQGIINLNLTEEISRYFSEGLSVYYYNITIGSVVGVLISPEERTCTINAINSILFPPVEQVKITSLGNNLQQIAVAYEVARTVSAYHLHMQLIGIYSEQCTYMNCTCITLNGWIKGKSRDTNVMYP